MEHRLDALSFELLFEVVRAANYLECDGLLSLASRATARSLHSLRTDPSLLAAVVGVPPVASSSAEYCVHEPILTLPSVDELRTEADDGGLCDEDALSMCLLECDAAMLRVFKSLSPCISGSNSSLITCHAHIGAPAPMQPARSSLRRFGHTMRPPYSSRGPHDWHGHIQSRASRDRLWCHRARSTLCGEQWQQRQTTLDLEWALGTQHVSLESKLWTCTSTVLAALPNLTVLTLLGTKVRQAGLRSHWPWIEVELHLHRDRGRWICTRSGISAT